MLSTSTAHSDGIICVGTYLLGILPLLVSRLLLTSIGTSLARPVIARAQISELPEKMFIRTSI